MKNLWTGNVIFCGTAILHVLIIDERRSSAVCHSFSILLEDFIGIVRLDNAGRNIVSLFECVTF